MHAMEFRVGMSFYSFSCYFLLAVGTSVLFPFSREFMSYDVIFLLVGMETNVIWRKCRILFKGFSFRLLYMDLKFRQIVFYFL